MEGFEFFNTLPKQLQKSIISRAKEITLSEGQNLYEQGDDLASLILLNSGRLRIYRHHESGQTITLYTLSAETASNIDISSASIHTPCIGTAKAQSECRVTLIALKDLYRLLAGNTGFQEYLFELFMYRNEILAQTIEDVRFTTLDERVLRWLKQMTNSCLSMTHEEIADYHGSSREVISRMLKRFEIQGYVRLSRKMIEVISA